MKTSPNTESSNPEVPPNTALAPVTAPPNSQEMMRQVLGAAGAEAFVTWDVTTSEGRRLMDRCEEEPDKRIREVANIRMMLRHVYARYDEWIDAESGEERSGVRICLIDTAGKIYSCVSNGIRKSILRLSIQHGLPPWPNGIAVVVKIQALEPPKMRLYLVNDEEDTPKGGKK